MDTKNVWRGPVAYADSGDSISTKTPSIFVNGSLAGSAILGFDPELNADLGRPLKGDAHAARPLPAG
jgi:hypothetical protein